jgi:hypothetical protein
MSIFLNVEFSQIVDTRLIGQDFSLPLSLSTKCLGDNIMSHCLYKEVRDNVCERRNYGARFDRKKIFNMYRFVDEKLKDILIICRFDGQCKIESLEMTIFDVLTVKTASRYLQNDVVYCIDSGSCWEFHALSDILVQYDQTIQGLEPVAYGEWNFDSSNDLAYFGCHYKEIDPLNKKFSYTNFYMHHRINNSKFKWCEAEIANFDSM